MGPTDVNSVSGGIPASSGTGGEDIGAIINKLSSAGLSPEQMQHLATSAATPVTGHSGQMPSSLQYQPKQFTPGGYNNTPSTTAAESKNKGIGNSISAVLNLLGKAGNEHENKKKLQIATDTQTLLVAQNSIDQAKQIMQNLPQDSPQRKQYEDLINVNMQKIQGILSDEKTRKVIAKGFSIDFTDPQNQTPENHAVEQGKQMAQTQIGAKPYAEQFMAKTPETLQPNTVAQSQFAAAVQQQKMNQETMKILVPYLSTMQRVQGAIDTAKIKELGANARTQAVENQKWEMQTRAINAAAALQKNKYSNEFGLVTARRNAAFEAEKAFYDYKTTDPAFLQARATEVQLKYSNAIDAANQNLSKVENDAQLNAPQLAKDPNAQKDYQQMIQTAKENIVQLTAQKESARKNMSLMLGGDDSDGDKSSKSISDTVGVNAIGSYTSEPESYINLYNESQSEGGSIP